MTTITNTVGQRIRTARENQGISQHALARQIDVYDRTVQRWENGLATPGTAILPDLAAALHIPIEDLIA